MKRSLQLLTLAATLGTSAFAGSALITKVNYPGFVHPDYAITEKCEVFADHVAITTVYGRQDGVVSTEKRSAKLQGDVQKLITAAAAAKLDEVDNGLCDGPSTTISAGQTLLYTTGGCGSPRKERAGGAAFTLRHMVDAYCPVTHKVGTRD